MQADYVIVGAGSAGCAMAYRLSEAGRSVIVIEHGGSDAGPFIQMPGALSYPMSMKRYDWGYRSEPEPHLGGRQLACPRGKVIGGSSSINGMVYVRGHAGDFDHWEEMGATGWGFADVLPYFKRMEHWHGPANAPSDGWRGTDGPLHVTRAAAQNPLTQAFIASAEQAGYGITPDYNGERQEGIGGFDATIFKGQRWSSANAYLKPALRRENCTLINGLARRVVITEGRATGVEIERNGSVEVIEARAEVILAASSINSPKLLMLSGIGPGLDLQSHGIDVIADRPGVGQNLQDHLEVYLQYAATQPVSLYKYWSLIGKAQVGVQWLMGGSGPGASNQFEAGGFIRSRAGIAYPDIQMHFLPIAVRYDGTVPHRGHGFQIHTGPMRARSRGAVTLRSSDPAAAPRIKFNYMSEEVDWTEFRAAIRLAREIVTQPAFNALRGAELQPGSACDSDEEIDAFVRAHAESAYHPCGTARMGAPEDHHAVVDPEARVIGVEALRVADSSIFPRIPNGNLNAPSIMVGEKVSDHILGRDPLPRENLEPWVHPNWATAQR